MAKSSQIRSQALLFIVATAALGAVVSCGTPALTGETDAGSFDSGAADSGAIDAGASDAGSPDGGASDSGTADAGASDAGSSDGGVTDGGTDAGTWDAGGCASPAVPRAVWVWDSSVVTNATNQATLFTFAQSHQIDRLYVQTGAGSSVLTSNLMQTAPSQLAAFLDAAQARCLSVEFLFGKSDWALTGFHSVPLALAQQTVTFSSGLSGAQPAGVHFDIEAHGIHGTLSSGTSYDWDTIAQRPAMVGQYLDLLDSLKAALAGSGLTLGVDIPFWYDSTTSGFNPQTRAGKTAPASEHVIDLVDRAVLMDYRDSAFGAGSNAATSSGGVFDLGQAEVSYAGTAGKKVVIGVETGGCVLSGPNLVLDGSLADNLTFCDEGRAAMEAELGKLSTAWSSAAGFGEFAVHHFGSWSDPTRMGP